MLDNVETRFTALIRERGFIALGYARKFLDRQMAKGMLKCQRRHFYHVMQQCFAPRKSGMDGKG
ncbi:hypothetical protein Hanom_Chr16g01442551 [Helianthus anomalus]